MSARNVLIAASLKELEYYLLVSRCARCGRGPGRLVRPAPTDQPGRVLDASVECAACCSNQPLRFRYEHVTRGEEINPSATPSRLLDLSQWMSLAALMEDASAGEASPAAARLALVRSAMCLTEALKFYGDDELPPPAALFTPQGSQAFAEHPEKFARQRLRDMLARLPAASAANARDVALAADRPWWRLW